MLYLLLCKSEHDNKLLLVENNCPLLLAIVLPLLCTRWKTWWFNGQLKLLLHYADKLFWDLSSSLNVAWHRSRCICMYVCLWSLLKSAFETHHSLECNNVSTIMQFSPSPIHYRLHVDWFWTTLFHLPPKVLPSNVILKT